MAFLLSFLKPLAYVSLPVILVRQVAVSSTIGRYYARVVFYVGTLVTVASCSVVIAAGMTLLGRSTDTNYYVARIFYAIISRGLDLHIKVEGEEHLETSPAVLMVNHQSMLDVLIIGRLMPKKTAIMSKKSLQYTPLGPFMTMSGTIFIDRGNSARAFRSIDAAGEKMKTDDTSLWMFPEGTRHLTREASMLPLKKGGFHLALNAGIPITPIVCENYWHLYHKGIFGSGTITVRVLPPISTKEFTVADVGLLSTRVHDQMVATILEISTHAPAPSRVQTPTPEKSEPVQVAAPLLAPTLAAVEEPQVEDSNSSRASSSERLKTSLSETGTETEEDEGMVLVGRPN